MKNILTRKFQSSPIWLWLYFGGFVFVFVAALAFGEAVIALMAVVMLVVVTALFIRNYLNEPINHA